MWIINVAYDRPYTFQAVEGRSAPEVRVIDRVVAPHAVVTTLAEKAGE